MSETTTNGAPVKLTTSSLGRLHMSVDEIIGGLSASGSADTPAEWLKDQPELRDYLERHVGSPVPRHPGLRKGAREFTLGGVGLALIFAALLVALAAYLGVI